MNLIANTGIQFFTIQLEINPNDNFKTFFHEWDDSEKSQLKLELAHYFSDEDLWVKKSDLKDLGYLKDGKVVVQDKNGEYRSASWETISKDFYSDGNKVIPIETEAPEDSGLFQMAINKVKWEKFENIWLPLPFFYLKENGKSDFGPINWCRFKLIPTKSDSKTKKYNLLLAFDTRSVFNNEGLNETPIFSSNYESGKNFALCNNEFQLIDYCSKSFKCDWVDGYILKIFHNKKSINELRDIPKPKLNYLAQYIYIIRYIQQLDILPTITLFSNKNAICGNVDLVVDIGNSRTCAVLFDNSDFTKCSPLELQDFTTPVFEGELNKYRDSFDMRLAFREADFGGKFGIENSRQFVYPSMIRLGKEANNLIHKSTNMNMGAEKTSTFSSPKRFLWDTKLQKQEWEFVQLEGETTKTICIKGISEQLKSDGSFANNESGSILTQYSRKALMTFAFLEILTQAKMQINSYEQRNHWGNESTPRKIGRIIITCPTAMSKVEQIALRKSAEDAIIMLDRFSNNAYFVPIDEKEIRTKFQVVPSVKNLSKNEDRTEWIYDEATAAQFVFLYAEIAKRYLKNVKDYFDRYGKMRNDLEDYNKKSLTIGSIDIGAGTTDVMIAAYKYDDAGQCTLTPVPLFWESFYIAGDDLLKELIHQLVIEGKFSPIENNLRTIKKTDEEIVRLNNDFFGGDNGMQVRNRQLRADFNLQISVPIVMKQLELLQNNEDSKILTFNDIFNDNLPSTSVLNRFKQHFGFDFESLQWNYENKTVSTIVEKVFDSMINKISSLFFYHKCDIVLLSGRPTSLKPLTDLFLKHYAISPNRLKTMNDYRVGRWYPEDKRYRFLDGSGHFINPKSIVTTGAMIANIAANGGIDGFALNMNEFIVKMTPTTKYFGKLNTDTLKFIETNISPENNNAIIEISSFPLRIGTRQLNSDACLSRPFYTLDINDFAIEDRAKGRVDDDNKEAVNIEIEKEKSKIRQKMPLKITIERNYSEDKEKLSIESVTGKDGYDLNVKFFNLQVQSMSELDNFWLDSGIFELKTTSKK